uniref:Retrotransposon gag domain-containing protein n=1 Tax=Bracon brevicornis TaxID=1563983 RepID=A0A6V7JTF3_9HYME
MDKLKSESNSKDLLDVIDPTVNALINLDEQTILKGRQTVREIITGRLDDKYYKKVLNIKDPSSILQSLKDSKKVENNVTHTSVRAKLHQLKLQPNEAIGDYCKKFDNIVTEYENCDNAVPLTEEEKSSAFYQAISNAVPEIRAADLIHRKTAKTSITIDELKSFLLELEADKKTDVTQISQTNPTANQA